VGANVSVAGLEADMEGRGEWTNLEVGGVGPVVFAGNVEEASFVNVAGADEAGKGGLVVRECEMRLGKPGVDVC